MLLTLLVKKKKNEVWLSKGPGKSAVAVIDSETEWAER